MSRTGRVAGVTDRAYEAVIRRRVFERENRGCRACGLGIPGGGGRDTLAHLPPQRRSQTRKRPPEERHTTTHTMRLCLSHHEHEERHRLQITPLTERGADGCCQFVFQGQVWTERPHPQPRVTAPSTTTG